MKEIAYLSEAEAKGLAAACQGKTLGESDHEEFTAESITRVRSRRARNRLGLSPAEVDQQSEEILAAIQVMEPEWLRLSPVIKVGLVEWAEGRSELGEYQRRKLIRICGDAGQKAKAFIRRNSSFPGG